MYHSFRVDIATEYGMAEAVFLQNIYFWIMKNRANKRHYYDGYYWTYNTQKAFTELFPYMSQSKISRMTRQLEEKGLLKSANYNKAGYDRTKWYTLTEKAELMLKGCNVANMQNEYSNMQSEYSNMQSELTIPYTNTYTNTDKEYVYSEVNENLKKISQLYQDNIGMINGIVAEDLKVISQEVSVELFEKAIKIAVDKGKFNFGYIKGILNQWRKNNIKTLDDLKERRPVKRKTTQRDKMKQEGHYGSKLNAKTVERTLKAEEIKSKFGL